MPKDIPNTLSPLGLREMARITTLPSIQRGAVWRPQQVEELWDSVLRGFPIGSFLLTHYNRNLGERNLPLAQNVQKPKYHLLDGQQRWNAILLGLDNIWTSPRIAIPNGQQHALWIDLEPAERRRDAPQFVFRVVTRSHPWGYQRDNPRNRLEARDRRAALDTYKEASRSIDGLDFRPGRLSLAYAWPWDASALVPFALVVEACLTRSDEPNIWQLLGELLLKNLPYWKANEELHSKHGNWKQGVLNLIQNPTRHMKGIVSAIRRNLGVVGEAGCQIPVQLLPADVMGGLAADDQRPNGLQGQQQLAEVLDPLEALFIRVNTGGTPLAGEELKYSLLKHYYPNVQGIEDTLRTKLMSPARLITLLSRLILARTDEGREEPPRDPDVARFRRLVQGRDRACPDFRKKIQEYLGFRDDGPPMPSRARNLLDKAQEILCDGDWGLPPVLVADLASHSPDAFFLLLTWLDRVSEATQSELSRPTMSDDDRRRLVGAVTALGWFAERPHDCLRGLFDRMNNTNGVEQLFSTGALEPCLQPAEGGALRLIPPLPPDYLQQAIDKRIIEPPDFELAEGELWGGRWNQWARFEIVDTAENWLEQHKVPEEIRKTAWHQLVRRLWDMRYLVLYAQRPIITNWFKDYDPTSLDQLEDTDRPWDFDHIHPKSYGGVNNVPRLIKEWHASIGNLRAWPLEVNRYHQNVAPGIKLAQPDPGEAGPPYYLTDGRELRRASFVAESGWPHWQASTPDGQAPGHHNYLIYPDKDNYRPCRPALIRAITSRWVALYRNWYDTLLVGSLFDSQEIRD